MAANGSLDWFQARRKMEISLRSCTMRPTELSKMLFQTASNSARTAMQSAAAPEHIKNLAHAVATTAEGLESLSTGLRATYMLLEQVKTLLERQNGPRLGKP